MAPTGVEPATYVYDSRYFEADAQTIRPPHCCSSNYYVTQVRKVNRALISKAKKTLIVKTIANVYRKFTNVKLIPQKGWGLIGRR